MSLRQMLVGTVRRALPGAIGLYEIECEDGRTSPIVIDDSSDLARRLDLDDLVGEYCELTGHMQLHVFIVETVEVLP